MPLPPLSRPLTAAAALAVAGLALAVVGGASAGAAQTSPERSAPAKFVPDGRYATKTGRVVGVLGPDRLVVRGGDDKTTVVKLAGINAPRAGRNECGVGAAERIVKRAALGKTVTVTSAPAFGYETSSGETIGVARVGKADVGSALIRAGWATPVIPLRGQLGVVKGYIKQASSARATRRAVLAKCSSASPKPTNVSDPWQMVGITPDTGVTIPSAWPSECYEWQYYCAEPPVVFPPTGSIPVAFWWDGPEGYGVDNPVREPGALCGNPFVIWDVPGEWDVPQSVEVRAELHRDRTTSAPIYIGVMEPRVGSGTWALFAPTFDGSMICFPDGHGVVSGTRSFTVAPPTTPPLTPSDYARDVFGYEPPPPATSPPPIPCPDSFFQQAPREVDAGKLEGRPVYRVISRLRVFDDPSRKCAQKLTFILENRRTGKRLVQVPGSTLGYRTLTGRQFSAPVISWPSNSEFKYDTGDGTGANRKNARLVHVAYLPRNTTITTEDVTLKIVRPIGSVFQADSFGGGVEWPSSQAG